MAPIEHPINKPGAVLPPKTCCISLKVVDKDVDVKLEGSRRLELSSEDIRGGRPANSTERVNTCLVLSDEPPVMSNEWSSDPMATSNWLTEH